MRLATFSPLSGGASRPGMVVGDGNIHDLPAEAQARSLAPEIDLRSMLGLIRGGKSVRAALDDIERDPRTKPLSLLDVRLDAPIPRPAKNVFCVGWNYLEHFQEGEKALKDDRVLPEHPVFVEAGGELGQGCHLIKRIRNHDDDGTRRMLGDVFGNATDDPRVRLDQAHPTHPRLAGQARGDHHDVGVGRGLVAAAINGGGGADDRGWGRILRFNHSSATS